MAISGDSHVIKPYRKKDGSTYDKVMLSSEHVEMSDGTSLEERNTFYKRHYEQIYRALRICTERTIIRG